MSCCIRFFKTVLGTDGHPFKVLQRTVTVEDAVSADEMMATAKTRFAELEGVPDWQLHADMAEFQSNRDVTFSHSDVGRVPTGGRGTRNRYVPGDVVNPQRQSRLAQAGTK